MIPLKVRSADPPAQAEAAAREAEENCTCAYPDRKAGTETGHAESCPAGKFLEQRKQRLAADPRWVRRL